MGQVLHGSATTTKAIRIWINFSLMEKRKKDVRVFRKEHRYHFGTHSNVKRSTVEEYLIVGQ